ncbi:MAG: LCP family protein, partial [Lachnospiraceae bacterium]|nr:LCP family protein [Lachnospiraceae bacterium]
TEPPVTQPPVTQPPATQPPATQPPATQPPATQGQNPTSSTRKPTQAPQTADPGPSQTIYVDTSNIYTNDLPQSMLNAMSNYYTFVIYGVDAHSQSTLLRWTNSDVVIIVSINKTTKEVRLASIYRDTLIEGGNNYYDKITNVYASQGVAGSLSAINRNFDLRINKFVTFNWKAVVDAVNVMGGVELKLTAAECEKINQTKGGVAAAVGVKTPRNLPVEDGTYQLDGVQVVSYARIRKLDSDIVRTQRQRKVITAMLNKAKTLPLTDLLGMVETVFSEIATSFDFSEIVSLLSDISSYDLNNTAGYPTWYNSKDTIYIAGLMDNNARLHEFLFNNPNYSPSGYVFNLHDRLAYLRAISLGYDY